MHLLAKSPLGAVPMCAVQVINYEIIVSLTAMLVAKPQSEQRPCSSVYQAWGSRQSAMLNKVMSAAQGVGFDGICANI